MLSEFERLEEYEKLCRRAIFEENRDLTPEERARAVELLLDPQPTEAQHATED